MIYDSKVSDQRKAFSPYDLAQTKDRCINCETTNIIHAPITLNEKRGLLCVKCFKSYQE